MQWLLFLLSCCVFFFLSFDISFGTMARAVAYPYTFEMLYKIQFTGPVRGHHVYKDNWAPFIGEQLTCRPDPREEALTYDKFALGVYKSTEGGTILVGHVPIELSQLLNYFLTTGEQRNNLMAEVTGKRKREIGLVVPVKYTAFTDDKLFAQVLLEKLEEKKKIIGIDITESKLKKLPCFVKVKNESEEKETEKKES